MKLFKDETQKTKEAANYSIGQELIWDSGAGFDVVSFKNESRIFQEKWLDCQMKTGESRGKVIPIDEKQLEKFSLAKWSEMRKRYNAC
jgi:hypothetical protein